MGSLGWSVFFVFTPMFAYAMVLTEAVSLEPVGEHDVADVRLVKHFFGSMDRSMLTLFSSVSGGLSWEEPMISLGAMDLHWFSCAYVVYIGGVVFAVLNVVTGVFVGSATAAADPEKKKAALISLEKFFDEADADGSGTLDAVEFKGMIENSVQLKTI